MFKPYAVEQSLLAQMEEHQVPGVAISIVQNGQILYARGFGVTSVEDQALDVTPETVFRIGSVTKSLTGTMILCLVEQGYLDLDKPISDYLPDLPAVREFTLRMLLSHTSGLPSDLIYYPQNTSTLHDFVYEKISHYARVAPAGRVYFYSNPGINLAAYVAERVMDTPYKRLMDDMLFRPLEMNRSTFDIAHAATFPLAQPHARDAENHVSVLRPHIDNAAEYPCGFAFSTALDMAKFMNLHLGHSSLLSNETRQLMHTPQVDRMDGTGYGLTFRTGSFRGARYVGHNGAIGKYGAIMRLHPDQDTGIFMVFNRAPGFWGAAGQTVNRILIDLLNLPEDEVNITSLPQTDTNLYGTYLGYNTGMVVISPDGVFINRKRDESARVGRVDDEFIMVNGSPCQRQVQPIPQERARDLTCYAGTYRADIDQWTVRINEDQQLCIYSEDDREEVVYVPLGEHTFAGDGNIIRFEVDSDGQPNSLIYANGYRFQRLIEQKNLADTR